MNYKERQQITKEVGVVIDAHMLRRHDYMIFTTKELDAYVKQKIKEYY